MSKDSQSRAPQPQADTSGIPGTAAHNAAADAAGRGHSGSTRPGAHRSPRKGFFRRNSRNNKLNTGRIPLTASLTVIVFVIILVAGIIMTFAAYELVQSALNDQTNTQLKQQADSIRNNVTLIQRQAARKNNIPDIPAPGSNGQMDSASSKDTAQALDDFLEAQGANGPTDYFLQIRDMNNTILATPFTPFASNNMISVPRLSETDSIKRQVPTDGEPVTVPANVHIYSNNYDQKIYERAATDWRVMAVSIINSETGKTEYVVYVARSLFWQRDAVRRVVQYFIIVDIAVIVCGAVLSLILILRALRPLKRIEKTAAEIAGGNLSERIPEGSANTEVGSLSSSLNAMLSRIEYSFKKQEDTTNQMKRFVSDASHELRTPLAAIHGYAELYRMQRRTPGAQERADATIEHIEVSSTRMSSLVEALLSLARLDEGRGIDLGQKIGVDQIVKESAEDLHALDPDRHITLGRLVIDGDDMLNKIASVASGTVQPVSQLNRFSGRRHTDTGRTHGYNGSDAGGNAAQAPAPVPSPAGSRISVVESSLPPVTIGGDPTRLRQVLTNIIGNIHRYTPADSPVEIGVSMVKAVASTADLSKYDPNEETLGTFLEDVARADRTNSGREFVVIRVSDHGSGIDPAKMEKIFERFYTTDPSRARQRGGSGLGMSIALAVVKAHHGFICASTTPGGGLSFTIVLPASQTRMFLDRNDYAELSGVSVADARRNREAQKRRRKRGKEGESQPVEAVQPGRDMPNSKS